MKLIIAGTRTFSDFNLLEKYLNKIEWPITEIVSGCADGADTLAITYAEKYNIPIKRFPADWKKYGKAAGPIRNKQMAEYGDALICFWDGVSNGTQNMIDQASRQKLKTFIVRYDNERIGVE
jgi:YspA, cpYpsA-related SLOG family